MIPFLRYKEKEYVLKNLFGPDVELSVEPITPADMFYTDGEASNSHCKVIINTLTTAYIPQLINIKMEHKLLLECWINMVKFATQHAEVHGKS